MKSTNQKAKAINAHLHKLGKAQLSKTDLNENVPIVVNSNKDLKDLVFKIKNLYDVIVEFKGNPAVIVLIDIIALDEAISKKYNQLFKGV